MSDQNNSTQEDNTPIEKSVTPSKLLKARKKLQKRYL